jgi:hypothetical protein
MQPRCTIWRYALVVSLDRVEHFDPVAMAQAFALPISFVAAHGTRRKPNEQWPDVRSAAQSLEDL